MAWGMTENSPPLRVGEMVSSEKAAFHQGELGIKVEVKFFREPEERLGKGEGWETGELMG